MQLRQTWNSKYFSNTAAKQFLLSKPHLKWRGFYHTCIWSINVHFFQPQTLVLPFYLEFSNQTQSEEKCENVYRRQCLELPFFPQTSPNKEMIMFIGSNALSFEPWTSNVLPREKSKEKHDNVYRQHGLQLWTLSFHASSTREVQEKHDNAYRQQCLELPKFHSSTREVQTKRW